MVGSSTTDAEKVAAIREALPAVAAGLYLNTPTAGPLPAESAAAMTEILDWEVRTGRAHRDREDDVAARIDEARGAVAAILTADLDEVWLAHGLGDALARAMRTIDWRPGDGLVVVADPALEAVPALAPPGTHVAIADDFEDALARDGAPPRLVAVPLVQSTTGERLPVEQLALWARERGCKVLVEASLALGAVPVDREALRADLLVARSEAWLLGPEGLAIVSGPAVSAQGQPNDAFHLPSVVGFARGCGWLSMYVGLPWIHERGAELTAFAAGRLGGLAGVELLTPEARATTLVFRIEGWPADRALEELGGRVFLLAGTVGEGIRIGLGAWNTVDEIDRLAEAVANLAAHTPESLPPRPRLTILGQGR